MVVYERVPKKHGTVLTFALSAVWHGFYPGYYLTFSTGALIVMAARKVSFTKIGKLELIFFQISHAACSVIIFKQPR
jgi:hypothetical protein